MSQEIWTVKRLLEWTADFLKQKDSDSPRLEAEVLLSHALGCKRIELYTNFETVPPEAQLAVFRDFVRRRGKGEPVAQLVGRKEFYSLDFNVTSDVLIPRPETEDLVLETIDLLKSRRQGTDADRLFTLCDLGTGSGNIAVTLAKHTKNTKIIAIDLSEKALAVAQKNAEKHEVSDRIDFIHSDLFTRLDPKTRFDMIVTNPPYVTTAEYAALAPMVRDYEPKEALLAGADGLDVVRRIVVDAIPLMNPGGNLLMEVSPMIIQAAAQLFSDQKGWTNVRTVSDQMNRPRFVLADTLS